MGPVAYPSRHRNNPQWKVATIRKFIFAILFTAISLRSNNLQLHIIPSFANPPTPTSSSLSHSSSHASLPNNTPTPTTPSDPITTVAYIISIFQCSPKMSQHLFDTATILQRSIKLNSHPKHPHSRYAFKLIAFTIGDIQPCDTFLKLAGFELSPQVPPINKLWIEMPEGSNLRSAIGDDGCCGDYELVKLNSYLLEEYAMVVHLDLDTLILRPMDELFNVMYFDPNGEEGREARRKLVDVVAPTYLNKRVYGAEGREQMEVEDVNATVAEGLLRNVTVNAFYTKDYNMIIPKSKQSKRVGVQGGFLVLRPSFETYKELISMVYTGEHYPGRDAENTGWFKSGYGMHIWGSLTIQGLLAYYFSELQVETSVELNRCKYNQIADNARVSTRNSKAKYPYGSILPFMRNESNPRYNYYDTDCRDGRKNCDDVDCQRAPVEETRVAHYTYCKMPMNCLDCNTVMETYKDLTCRKLIREWFRVRRTLPGVNDMGWWNVDDYKGGSSTDCYNEYYLGYCDQQKGYKRIDHRNWTALKDDYVVVP
mmetsp:Transcript_20598/g.42882  ORF Transcript_20598/g.42882 Transcript_20598/m.42882 type:complete len:539 (+) Transcript_20598:602-2218(+)